MPFESCKSPKMEFLESRDKRYVFMYTGELQDMLNDIHMYYPLVGVLQSAVHRVMLLGTSSVIVSGLW